VTPENVASVFATTGADAVMIGRGAILNPWIFREAKHYLATGELLPEATLEERVKTLREHLDLAIEHKGERVGVLEMRKHYAGYLRHMPMMARIRAGLMTFTQKGEIDRFLEGLLETYPHGQIPEVEGVPREAIQQEQAAATLRPHP
jgi:tRNA-dihydrouridine synthase